MAQIVLLDVGSSYVVWKEKKKTPPSSRYVVEHGEHKQGARSCSTCTARVLVERKRRKRYPEASSLYQGKYNCLPLVVEPSRIVLADDWISSQSSLFRLINPFSWFRRYVCFIHWNPYDPNWKKEIRSCWSVKYSSLEETRQINQGCSRRRRGEFLAPLQTVNGATRKVHNPVGFELTTFSVKWRRLSLGNTWVRYANDRFYIAHDCCACTSYTLCQ